MKGSAKRSMNVRKMYELYEQQCNLYSKHQERKQRIRELKEEQKQLSKTDGRVHTVTFDMQQVLTSPMMNVGTLYYKREYNTYNFTVYSLKDAECDCYMWHETTAKGDGVK